MSAFMHSETAFNSIGNKLEQLLMGSSFEKHSVEHALGISSRELSCERIEEVVKEFINALYKQNARSVNTRYGHRDDVNEPETFAYKPSQSKPLSLIGLYKLLQSVDYQSNETTDYYDLPETRVLREMINGLATHIIAQIKEYKDAEWSL